MTVILLGASFVTTVDIESSRSLETLQTTAPRALFCASTALASIAMPLESRTVAVIVTLAPGATEGLATSNVIWFGGPGVGLGGGVAEELGGEYKVRSRELDIS